jgi:hypothetical protein
MLQSDYARSSFEDAVIQSTRLGETYMKLTGDVVWPLSDRIAVAAEKIRTVAA